MQQYFAAMGRGEDLSQFFTEDVTWLMADSGEQVRGASAARDYILDLHSRIVSQKSSDLVVTDGKAYLEGFFVKSTKATSEDYSYCLVYDLHGSRISAMRCYGTLAALMARVNSLG
jgi:hypothetical protein